MTTEATNKLYIGNLDYSVDSEELKAAFAQWTVTDCAVIEGKGFAFVTFENTESAGAAKDEFSNKELKGRPLKIDFAREKSRDNNRSGGGDRRSGGYNKRY